MKVVTFCFRNLKSTQSIHRFVLPFFNIYDGSSIWQDLEYTGRVTVGKVPI